MVIRFAIKSVIKQPTNRMSQGVAVEGDADVGPGKENLGDQRGGVGGAAAVVDVAAVGLIGDHVNVGARGAEDPGGHVVGSSVGAVEYQPYRQ